MEPSTSKANENELNYNSDSSCSSDGTSEKCPICLLSLQEQEIGKPSTCEHLFCYICISEWAKVVRTCPIDRSEFKEITILKSFDDRSLLRSEPLDKKCVGLDEFLGDDEITYCEVCRQSDREDQMLLCDGCDLGFHMSCLPNPLTEIPHGNWYCDNCFSSESEEDESNIAHEINLLNADIEDNGGLTLTRLRFARQRSPVSRTRQSQRIVSAIRRIRDSNSEDETPVPTASTSRSVTTSRKRRSRKRTVRRRYRTVITEYDVDGDDKFAMKTRKIRRKIRRRRRKQAKSSRSERRSKSTNNNLSMLKNTNAFDLQQSRAAAGITNFSIFEPANQLDYVSDENLDVDLYSEYPGRGEGCLIAPAGAIHPHRNRSLKKSMLIKQRVLENIPTTSSVNILDSIMQQQEMWLDKNAFRKNFTVETSGKVKCLASSKDKAPCDGGDQNHTQNSNSNQVNFGTNSTQTKPTENQNVDVGSQNVASSGLVSGNSGSNRNNDEIHGPQQGHFISSFAPAVDKKEKSDEKDKNKDDCPNFSIYSAESLNFLTKDQDTSNVDATGPSEEHELYDLVQESDGDDAVGNEKSEIYNPDSPTGNDDEIYNPESPTNFDTDSTPKTTSNSNFQIAKTPEPAEMPTFKGMQVKGFKKPLVDFDMFEDSDEIENKKESADKTEPDESGSYTPPIKQPDSAKKSNPDEKSKRQQKDKTDKREIEIYDIRKRIGTRDEFGRNKSRSRSMSKERRSRSRSRSSNCSRSASKRRFLRKRSRKRSDSGSPADDRRKRLRRERSESKSRRNKNKRRRSKSRSRTPPPRRHRSRSFSISPSPKPVRSPSWSRSRSRSNTRHKNLRRDPPKYRHRSKSRKQSKSRDNKVKKRKTNRKSRTRTPPLPASMQKPRNVSPSPPKKAPRDSDQKNQKKSKKKKSESSKSKGLRSTVAVPSTLSKEVFTSGENILVSVNFNNNKTNKVSPHLRRSNSKEKDRIKLLEAPKEVVDITTKKKLDSVKPVAIIDLDRSPFKELTPEYNVIELSDSENEKQIKSPDPPKSPAAKLYDPYDILNSPAENVTSSVENFGADVTTTAQTTIQQNHMLAKEKDDKVTDQSMINVYNTTITAIPCISASSGEDNVDMIVTSSSANPNCKVDTVDDKNQNNSQLSPYPDLNASALDSPYSPASDGYDDLFAASSYHTDSPKKSAKSAKMGKNSGGSKTVEKFDALFGSTSPVTAPAKKHRKKTDSSDQPNKLLLKLNRQERAIEESKVALKPYYSKRVIDKNEYKEILRKAVPKICHSKSGEINPKKIKDLIDAYVKKVKYRKKHGLSSF